MATVADDKNTYYYLCRLFPEDIRKLLRVFRGAPECVSEQKTQKLCGMRSKSQKLKYLFGKFNRLTSSALHNQLKLIASEKKDMSFYVLVALGKNENPQPIFWREHRAILTETAFHYCVNNSIFLYLPFTIDMRQNGSSELEGEDLSSVFDKYPCFGCNILRLIYAKYFLTGISNTMNRLRSEYFANSGKIKALLTLTLVFPFAIFGYQYYTYYAPCLLNWFLPLVQLILGMAAFLATSYITIMEFLDVCALKNYLNKNMPFYRTVIWSLFGFINLNDKTKDPLEYQLDIVKTKIGKISALFSAAVIPTLVVIQNALKGLNVIS